VKSLKYSSDSQVTVRTGQKFISEEEVKRLREKESNLRWISKNYDLLLSKYEGQYVAAKGGDVVAYGEDHKKLVSGLRKQYGLNFCTVAVKYITQKRNIVYPSV
jgi:hypothetical protein